VFIEKSGEIIPQVVKVILEKRTGEETPFTFPKRCRSAIPAGETGRQAVTRCPNPDCPAKIRAGLIHFFAAGNAD
jgi:DNA ligase (NAD+)